jgi:hypothetical protein
MPQVLPYPLVERLFYHHRAHVAPAEVQNHEFDPDELQSLDYMYYAAGLVALFKLLQVPLHLSQAHSTTKLFSRGSMSYTK